jgi:hypothetical protein
MFIDQNTRELRQERGLRDDHPLTSDSTVWHSLSCAWCLSEQGIAASEGSHGTCANHHDAAHHAFMNLPPYTRTREGQARQLERGPKPCRVGL